jgi:trehalose 6-phosphate synthase/phosphatase
MSRLLILANRLPVTLHSADGQVSLVPSTGGLATALRTLHDRTEGVWIGWPGETYPTPEPQRRAIDARLTEMRAVPIHLDPGEVSRYYEGFANGTLWPLLHHFLDTARLDDDGPFETYGTINERFAAAAAARYRPGDLIWVHDYHLMLAPEMLRRRLPQARIGFFLHTPFPSSEVFCTLPRREKLLHGLLGADVIGFQTASYRRHFLHTVRRLLDIEPEREGDAVAYEGRRVRLGVYPIGVDARAFAELAARPAIREETRKIREQAPGQRIVLGVDRLDYTKGIRLRLAAIERLLDRSPLHRRVRFVQLAVPTRHGVGAYEELRRDVHEMVGRINGRHGSVDFVPIHCLHQSMPIERLTALYTAADVMLVTPLRDGMNLVAKEYVATRLDRTGALVLSEFTGAAVELAEALIVNPHDTGSVASAIERALAMPVAEQRARMTALRERVVAHDVHRWAQSFLVDLERSGAPSPSPARRSEAPPRALAQRLREAPGLTLILDYDGTLVPLAPLPDLAPPDAELLSLLRDLASRPGTRVHLASGRKWEDLERWFGELPIHLHAEHGVCSRPAGGAWTTVPLPPTTWKAAVRSILDEASRGTPGSLVEEKTASLGWHYRNVEVELGRARLRELEGRLEGLLAAYDLEALRGLKVLEVRTRGPNKGLAVRRALANGAEGLAILAIGDDRTDEDLFAALPPPAVTIHVGRGASQADFRLPDPEAVRALLRSFLPGGPHFPPAGFGQGSGSYSPARSARA